MVYARPASRHLARVVKLCTGSGRLLSKMWVVLFFTCLLACSFAMDRCGPGINTAGVTIPNGDILIEFGNPLEIFCILNPNQHDELGRTSRNLVFYHNEKPVPPEFVNTVNSTTIRLYVKMPPPSKSMYYCNLDTGNETRGLDPVCFNSVSVAFKPAEVLDFECISHNWENLQCTWKKPENYVKTTYSLRLRLPGRAGGRANYMCPHDLDITEDRCYWDLRTDPHYRQPYEYYYFTITGENVLGNITFPVIKFHHYSHVIPNPPLNLSLLNGTAESVCLAWQVPINMRSFPPGIIHKVKYQSVWDSRDHWEVFNTNHLNVKSPVHVLNITGLKYANTLYDVKVYMKSAVVAPIGEDRWSIPANLTVKTKPTVPGSAPKTDIGSFEVSGGLPNRDVYLYWQHIPESEKNGDNFEYQVYRVDENGKEHLVIPHDSSKSYAMLKGIEFNSHKFVIVSVNQEGRSRNKSTVYIPSRMDSPPEPLSFTKIAYQNGMYELSWKPPKPSNFTIDSYTIFWCDNERDRPYQCKGYLNWTHVPKNASVKKIQVLDVSKIYQFAISANTKDASSGMVWASCTVIYDKVVGKMKNVWINSIGPTFIEVGWKLDCSDRVGMVTGFRIYFCPIKSPLNLACKEPVMNTTILGDPSTIHGKVTGLKPYTTYMVAVAVETKNGVGHQSDPLYNTTLEAAPEQLKEVTVTDITNASMMVSWEPPSPMNGVLRFYKVYYNDKEAKVELPNTSLQLTNLRSYYNYSISVSACTVLCSPQSVAVVALTDIGSPDKMERPVVRFLNSSQVLVSWQPPLHSAGFLNYYEVMVVQEGGGSNMSQFFYVTSDITSQVPIPDCESEGSTLMYKFSVRGVNIGPDNVSYPGPWSVPDVSNCYKQPVSPIVMIMIWVFGSLAVTALCLVVGYMGKRVWRQCKVMQDVEVKLPPGLAPIGEKEKDQEYHMHVHSWPMSDNRDLHKIRTSADEELLLAKKEDRHGRNPSGDSSGCSSGHESVSSSLTSGTHMSSDSGTEVDQRAASPDGDGVFSESPAWECSSLRQRNVSSRTDSGDPYVKMGSVSVVARSTPNLSDLPEGLGTSGLGAGACLGTWSSAGYISMPSSEEMSHHVSEPVATTGYCRVGLDSGDPISDDILHRHRPVKGYVSLASMIDSSSSPSSSSLGQGYVAHHPKDPTPKAYVTVPPSYCDRPEPPQTEPDQSYCRMGIHPGIKPAGSGYVTLSDPPRAPDIPRGGGYVPHTRFADKKDQSRKPEELYVQVFAPGAGDTGKSPTTSV